MNRKLVFLFIALLLPGLIYTFLKLLGSNSFTVTPLFQQEEKIPEGCSPVMFPYVIPEQAYARLSSDANKTDSLIIIFYKVRIETLQHTAAYLKGIESDIAGNDGIGLIKIDDDRVALKCLLLVEPPKDIVLIDRNRRIRGQYASADRDDIDRLSTELDIILKNY